MGFVILTRLGMGINNPFVAKAAISCLPTAKIADGTSTLNFFRLLGTSLGTTAWVVFLEIRTQMHTATFSFTQTGSNNTSLLFLQEVKELLKQTGLSEFVKNQSSLDYLGKVIHSQGSALGFQDGFLIFAIIFGVAIIPAILMVNKK
tara:strand:- start:495 stop:935 length:441 start_codon:yes stop_codon:yes gene_type:complete